MTEEGCLREMIEQFILERRQVKLKELRDSDPEKTEALEEKYQVSAWLDDAARRVQQLTVVTHGVKFLNPGAQGSNIFEHNSAARSRHFASSADLPPQFTPDAVGNAAQLDVYKFLQLRHNEESLLSRIARNDPILRKALPGNDEQKNNWIAAFSRIMQSKGSPATHTLAKQIYFPVSDDSYHLLAPLYPTALVNEVYRRIQNRYSEQNRAALKAKKEKKPSTISHFDFPDLAIQKFGGTKPQNISQLNSERHGQAFLLASLPPLWQTTAVRAPFGVDSIFHRIAAIKTRIPIKVLKAFLTKVQDKTSTAEIRRQREEYVAEIIDLILLYASEIQQLPSGWSADERCRLLPHQAYWLDPNRTGDAWAQQRNKTNWIDKVSHEFGEWMNESLQTEKMRFGDEERVEWKKLFENELRWLNPEA